MSSQLFALRNAATNIETISPGEILPIGSFIVVDDQYLHGPNHRALSDLRRINPWSPIIHVTRRPPPAALLALLDERGTSISVCLHTASGWPPRELLRLVIARRAPPDAPALAAYVSERCSRGLGHMVLEALTTNGACPHLRRPLRRGGDMTPEDWRALRDAITAISIATVGSLTQAGAASRVGVARNTVSRWIGRFWARTWAELVEIAAWEAILEAALMYRRYLQATETSVLIPFR